MHLYDQRFRTPHKTQKEKERAEQQGVVAGKASMLLRCVAW